MSTCPHCGKAIDDEKLGDGICPQCKKRWNPHRQVKTADPTGAVDGTLVPEDAAEVDQPNEDQHVVPRQPDSVQRTEIAESPNDTILQAPGDLSDDSNVNGQPTASSQGTSSPSDLMGSDSDTLANDAAPALTVDLPSSVLASCDSPRATMRIDSSQKREKDSVVRPRSLKFSNEPGADVADYELLEKIGEGGMGVVYRARQKSIDREVAIKQIKESAAERIENRSRFLGEASFTGELAHPNIVPVHDLGEGDDGSLFYSMKVVTGEPWESVLPRKSRQENLEILLRVADAIAFAHSKHIVHRDLKPENVMLGRFGEVLVMDWGLAIDVTQDAQPGAGGSPAYMAPEMAGEFLSVINSRYKAPPHPVGKHSDVYLLGAILFQIVTGVPPHSGHGDTGQQEIMQCLLNAAQNVVVSVPEKGDELLNVAMRALATEPQDRYSTVEDFQSAVRDYQSHVQSIGLTERATVDLETAKKTKEKSYEIYSRAVFGFQDALELWAGNARANTGLQQAKLSYAEAAYRNRDFELGAQLLNPDIPEERKLYERLMRAARERDLKTRRLKVARLSAAVLLLTMLAGTFGFSLHVSRLKQQAEFARDDAEVERDRARDAEKKERDAKLLEKRAKEEALAAKESERDAKLLEKKAKEEALAAKDAERIAKENAIGLLAEARYGRFVSRISLAGARIGNSDPRRALDLLAQIKDDVAATDNLTLDWEWQRLQYLCHPEIRDLDSGGLAAVASMTGDGKRAVTGAVADGTAIIMVWDTETRQATATMEKVPARDIRSVAISPDGNFVFAGCRGMTTADATLFSWDVRTGAKIDEHAAHFGNVSALAMSKDGHLLASTAARPNAHNPPVQLWSVRAGQLEKRQGFGDHSAAVGTVAFSPDQRFLAEADYSAKRDETRIVLRNLAQAADSRIIEVPAQKVHCVEFSPTESVLGCGTDKNQVLLYDVSKAPPLKSPNQQAVPKSLFGHHAPVHSLTFVSNNATKGVVSASADGAVIIWDVEKSKLRQTLGGHRATVNSCRYGGGTLISADRDGIVRLWNLQRYRDHLELPGPDEIHAVRISRTGSRVIIGTDDGHARIYTTSTGSVAHDFYVGHDKPSTSAHLDQQSKRLFTCSPEGTLCVWDTESGKQVMRWTDLDGDCRFAVSPGGQFVAVAADGRHPTRIMMVASGAVVDQLGDRDKEITSLSIVDQQCNQLVIGLGNGRIFLWDRSLNAMLWENVKGDEHARRVSAIRIDPASKFIVTLSDDGNELRQWSLQGKLQKVLPLPGRPRQVSGSKNILAIVCDNVEQPNEPLVFWDPRTQQQLPSILPNKLMQEVVSAALAPDEDTVYLLTKKDRQLLSWSFAESKLTVTGISDRVQRVGPDSLLMASASRLLTFGSTEPRIWDLSDNSEFQRFGGPVVAAGFVADESLAATLSADGVIRVWDAREYDPANPRQLVQQISAGAGRKITHLVVGPNGKLAFGIVRGPLSHEAYIWDLETATGQAILNDLPRNVIAADWRGDRIALATADTVLVWDRQAQQSLPVLQRSGGIVTCVGLSHDASQLVTGSADGIARVYQMPAPEEKWNNAEVIELTTADHSPTSLSSVAFTPSDRRVITGDALGSMSIWYFSRDHVQELYSLRGHNGEIRSTHFSVGDAASLVTSDPAKAIVRFTTALPINDRPEQTASSGLVPQFGSTK